MYFLLSALYKALKCPKYTSKHTINLNVSNYWLNERMKQKIGSIRMFASTKE